MKQINIDWLNSGSCVIVPSNSRWQMDVHKAIGHLMCFQKKKQQPTTLSNSLLCMPDHSGKKKVKKENITQHSCSQSTSDNFSVLYHQKMWFSIFCWEWNLDLTMHFCSSLRIKSHGRPYMNSLCKTILLEKCCLLIIQ